MQNQNQSRPAAAGRTSELDAAAQAAGRGLFTGALQSNPLVALGALLLSPILGLFKKRAVAPNRVSKLKLETYSSTPIAAGASKGHTNGASLDGHWTDNGRTLVRGARVSRANRAISSRSAALAAKGGE